MVMPKAGLRGPGATAAQPTGGPAHRPSTPSTFQYNRRTPEAVAKRQQQYATGDKDWFLKDGTATFTPQAGDNWARILPHTWDGADHYALDVRVHYQIGSDKGAFLCPLEMQEQPCPICEEYQAAVRERDDDYAKELKPNKVLLVWMIDRNKESEGPKIWTMPTGIDRELMALAQDTRTGETIFIEDHVSGYDIEFKRNGTGMQTKYIGVRIARQPSEACAPEILEYIQRNPIPSLLIYHDYDYIQRAFTGQAAQPAAADDSRPAAPTRAVTSAAAPARTPLARRPTAAEPEPAPTTGTGTYTRADVMAMDLNGLVDLALENSVQIPDNVPDDQVADYMCQQLGLEEAPTRAAPAAAVSPRARLAALPGRGQ